MDLNKFALLIAKKEGGKKQINIAQIKEILKVINKLTGGVLYALVRAIKVVQN